MTKIIITSTIEAPYLKKSIKVFKFYIGCLLFSLLVNIITGSFKKDYLILIETIVALPIFALIILAPIGLFNSWKSYKTKEEPRKKRTLFFLGHMFFCTVALLIIMSIIKNLVTIK